MGSFPLFTHLTISLEPPKCSRHVHGLRGDIMANSLKDESDSIRWRSDGRAYHSRENRMCISLVAEAKVTKDSVAGEMDRGWTGMALFAPLGTFAFS